MPNRYLTRKNIILEIIILLFVVIVSILIYQLIFGIDISYSNDYDMKLFETKRTLLILDISGRFFFPIYFIISISRLLYSKFLNTLFAFEMTISSVFLTTVLLYFYIYASTDTNVFTTEGWTIYPSLESPSLLNPKALIVVPYHKQTLEIIIPTIVILTIILDCLIIIKKKRNRA